MSRFRIVVAAALATVTFVVSAAPVTAAAWDNKGCPKGHHC
jgi:Spy/CpxP family protein refolding chaperone